MWICGVGCERGDIKIGCDLVIFRVCGADGSAEKGVACRMRERARGRECVREGATERDDTQMK